MNLKKLLGNNDEQLLTAKQYRISTALRIRAGQSLTVLAPLAAIGAVTNDPALMIPALYIVVAQGHSWQWLKAPMVRLSGSKHFWRSLGIFAGIYAAYWLVPTGWFMKTGPYHPYIRHAARVIAGEYQLTLLVVGLTLSVLMGGLSYLWMKGGKTQAMQRIAAHLAAQEAENA